MRIQPKRSFVAIDAKLREVTNPKHRVMLENYRAHLAAEVGADLERIMATMTPEPVYHSYGRGLEAGPKGQAATRAFYQRIFDEGTNVLEREIDRLTVDDWGIVSEGTIHIINPGKVLAARGTKVDDENAHYLLSVRIAAFLPYENGLMAGEDTYTSPAST